MKIFSRSQIREADAATIKNQGITSIELMERAAISCTDWISNKFGAEQKIIVVCGLGNNGGDGLAIARLLADRNYNVDVFIIHYSEKKSTDFSLNLQRLKLLSRIRLHIYDIKDLSSFQEAFVPQNGILVDALFGSGLNKPIEGLTAEIINLINKKKNVTISIDLPSGLYPDILNDKNDIIISSDHTLTFQFPKLSFMFVENAKRVGEFSVLDIGLDQHFIDSENTSNYFITKETVKEFFITRERTAHKGNYGHALIIAGSYGKMGAASLSASSCLKSGVGLLTVHVPKCGYEIIQISNPEAMVEIDSEENFVTDNIRLEKYNAIGIGPGIGNEKQTENVVKLIIQNSIAPIVFDADSLNILSENKTWLSFMPANSIFTPHLKEFERLAGKAESTIERLKLQKEFSFKYKVFVVLKGMHTSISTPDGDVFFNSTGNPGMATGGSGDVLTGIITSLIAQHYSSKEACILGVYLHGLAGDFAANNKTEEGMIASDIIENIHNAFSFIKEEI